MSRIGERSDEVKIISETAGGYIVDADGWSFESCPSCGTLVGEWLTEDVAARKHGRSALLIEKKRAYVDEAAERLAQQVIAA